MAQEKKQSLSIPKLERRQTADFTIKSNHNPSEKLADNMQLFVEKNTHAYWTGTCSVQALSKAQVRGRYYEEYKKWLGLAIYKLLGIPAPPTALCSQLPVKPAGEPSTDLDYTTPCLHIMSKRVSGSNFEKNFLATYKTITAKGQPLEIEVKEKSTVPLQGFGAAYAVACFICDLDTLNNNLGCIIRDKDSKSHAQIFITAPGSALDSLENFDDTDPDRKRASNTTALFYDQLPPTDQQEFIATVKKILQTPASTFKTLIAQVVCKEGYTAQQAERLLIQLIARKSILMTAFAAEVDPDLREEVRLAREQLPIVLTKNLPVTLDAKIESTLPDEETKEVKHLQLQSEKMAEQIPSNKPKLLDEDSVDETYALDTEGTEQVNHTQHPVKSKTAIDRIRITPKFSKLLEQLTPIKEEKQKPHCFRPPVVDLYEELKEQKPRCFRLPVVDPHFTGRATLLDHLAKQLHNYTAVLITQDVSNPGGIGKTQLAARYAELASTGAKCGDQNLSYQAVLWLHAEYNLSVQFLALANELCGHSNISGTEAVQSVYKFLQPRYALIVFDNVMDTTSLDPFLPPESGEESNIFSSLCHIIFISHNPKMESVLPKVIVQGFDPAETRSYVQKRLPQATEEEINALTSSVGNLPLALSQAVTFICKNYSTLANYPRLFALQQFSLCEPPTTTENLKNIIYTTFLLIRATLLRQHPCIAFILETAACLAAEGIPLSLLQEHVKFDPFPLSAVKEGLSALIDHAIIQSDKQGGLNMQRLIQQLALQQLSIAALHKQLEQTLQFIAMYHTTILTHTTRATLLPHLCALVERHKTSGRLEDHHLGKVLLLLGNIYGRLSDNTRSRDLLERALQLQKQSLGDQHKDVAHTLTSLGSIHGALGNIQKQCELFEQALEIKETYYTGKRAHNMLPILNSLCHIYEVLNRREKQRCLLLKGLAIQVKHCDGNSHHPLLNALLKLSECYKALKVDLSEQNTLLTRILSIQEIHCGNIHPDTLLSSIRLVINLRLMGNDHEALPIARRIRSVLIFNSQYGQGHELTKRYLRYLTTHGFTNAELLPLPLPREQKLKDKKQRPLPTESYVPIILDPKLMPTLMKLVDDISRVLQTEYPGDPYAPATIAIHVIDACTKGDIQFTAPSSIPPELLPMLRKFVKENSILQTLKQQGKLADKVKSVLHEELSRPTPHTTPPEYPTRKEEPCLLM